MVPCPDIPDNVAVGLSPPVGGLGVVVTRARGPELPASGSDAPGPYLP